MQRLLAGTGSPSDAEGRMPRIVTTADVLGGDPRLENHRIGVYDVYQRYVEADDSPEAIATRLDITVAEVHAALAYAFTNLDAMRAIEARNRTQDEDSESRVVPDDA